MLTEQERFMKEAIRQAKKAEALSCRRSGSDLLYKK